MPEEKEFRFEYETEEKETLSFWQLGLYPSQKRRIDKAVEALKIHGHKVNDQKLVRKMIDTCLDYMEIPMY